jgi:hypothetical protein
MRKPSPAGVVNNRQARRIAKSKAAKPQHVHTTGKFKIDRDANLLLAEVGAEGHHDDLLLTTPETAERLKVSTQWLEIGRHKGYGPPFVRMAPGVIRYRLGTLKEYLKEREFTHVAQYKSSKTGVEA